MLFPTRKAMAAGEALKEAVASHETIQALSEPNYSADDLAVAAMHSRQDIIGIYSMLTDSHRQLVAISRGVWLAAFVLILILANQS